MEKKVKTLLFLIDENNEKILLGMKKVRFGAGRWNGYGGKVDPGETVEAAALREMEEESGIKGDPENLFKHAVITFYMANYGTDEVHIYRLKEWDGEPIETEEMKPQWYAFDQIPFDKMWPDDQHWLPKILNNEVFEGAFWFDNKDNIVKFELTPLQT